METEIPINLFGITESLMQSPSCSISKTNTTVLCTVFPTQTEVAIQYLVYSPQQITIYCVLLLDNHNIECYTVVVIDFCAFPLWDMNGSFIRGILSTLHTLLSLYVSVSGIIAPNRAGH